MPGARGHLYFLVGMQHQYFRMSFRAWYGRVAVQRTEATAEILVLIPTHVLIAEKYYLILQ